MKDPLSESQKKNTFDPRVNKERKLYRLYKIIRLKKLIESLYQTNNEPLI